ncbi:MAG: heme-binding domain-containing protein, partial [Verrucomicrobiae bacterium]|nr:heme-binding domain-containing protein [Verrucomicrobiae bacterium]
DFESGAHRGRFNPTDGQLYVSGADGWGNYAITDGDFARIRYLDDHMHLPIGWAAHRNGVVVEFAEPIDPESLKPENFFAQAWNYEYADAYGSLEYSLKQPEMPGHDPVKVTSVHAIGDDGKSIFIEMPDMQPAMQMQIHGRLKSEADGETFKLDLYPTVLWLRDDFTGFDGYHASDPAKPSQLTLRVKYPFPFIPKHPPGKPGRKIAVTAISGLQFDVKEIHAKAGEALTIEFRNLDTIPHNFVLAAAGKLMDVGNAANMMLSNPKAAEQHYVPQSDDVLDYTPMLLHNRRFSLNLAAPNTPGRYPFLCTYPGHWAVMNGVLVVE